MHINVQKKFTERKKAAIAKINEFSYFSPTEKENMIRPLKKIDTIVSFEKAFSHIEEKMKEVQK